MTFSPARFISVVKLDLATRMRKIVISILALLTVVTIIDIVVCIHSFKARIIDTLGYINPFVILTCMSIVPSIAFKEFAGKTRTVNLLMLPASTLEKWLSRWVLTVPVATVVILGVVCLAGLISAAICCTHMEYPEFSSIDIMSCLSSIPVFKFICIAILLQSAYFLGSLLWPALSWAKTTLALTLFALIVFSLLLSFPTTTYREMWGAGLPAAIIIYIISYFRLKEAEIINHW